MNIFVVMPFKDAYTPIYEDIILRACKDKGLPATRGDKILEPGNIPQQTLQRILDAYFIIAEVSEDNPNVFYELGYAHSSNKPIIAIANRERELPFDISGERTIFYDKTLPGWELKLRNDLDDAIDHLHQISNRLKVDKITPGAEFSGHRHEITGSIVGLEGGEHLWMFVRRDGIGFWAAQNDGEIEVERNGSWRAIMYLGWAHEEEAQNNWFDILFGTLNTIDNKELTKGCINNQINADFPPRPLPQSFKEIARFRIKRVN